MDSKDLMPLDKYVFWLNSMTTTELHKEFPGEFHVLKASDSVDESVKNVLANDAILWRMVKEHAQKLAELNRKHKPDKKLNDMETEANTYANKYDLNARMAAYLGFKRGYDYHSQLLGMEKEEIPAEINVMYNKKVYTTGNRYNDLVELYKDDLFYKTVRRSDITII
jgi:hypothetical protein